MGKIQFQSPQDKSAAIHLSPIQNSCSQSVSKVELLNIQTFLSSFSSILLTMTSSVMSAREVMTLAGGSSCSTLFFFFWKSQITVKLVRVKFFDSTWRYLLCNVKKTCIYLFLLAFLFFFLEINRCYVWYKAPCPLCQQFDSFCCKNETKSSV